MDEMSRNTFKNLDKTERALLKNYQSALSTVRGQMADALSKGVDPETGAPTYVGMVKYKRLAALEQQLVDEIARAGKGAVDEIGTHARSSYESNYLWQAYQLEKGARMGLSFAILDRAAIARALDEHLTPLDKIAMRGIVDKQALRNLIRQQLTQGLTLGESIPKMQRRIQSVMEANATRATRIARTETTRIMNGARSDAMSHGAAMGLKLNKRWLSTLDSRTRDSHRNVDGEIVPLDKAFSNGLKQPGDAGAPAAEVINCRCVIITEIAGYSSQLKQRRDNTTGELIGDMSYKEWVEHKKTGEVPPAVQKRQAQRQQARAAGRVVFSDKATVAEVEQYIREELKLQGSNLSGFNIDAANTTGRALSDFREEFGDLGAMKSIGSYAEQFNLRAGPGVLGGYRRNQIGLVGVKKSTTWAGAKQRIAAGKASGHFTNGDERSVVWHEMGHAIYMGDPRIRPETKAEIVGLFKGMRADAYAAKKGTAGYAEVLSKYGGTDIDEFVAEAVSEYMGKNPRPLAKKIGDLLKADMKGGTGS